jgi:hypothetical protein
MRTDGPHPLFVPSQAARPGPSPWPPAPTPTKIDSVDVLTGILLLLGVGFLAANLKLAFDYVRFLRRRQRALLTWPAPKPPQYTFALGLGVALGLLVFAKLVLLHRQAFGESMMFLYYAYFFPMSLTIGRGFYEDGIWAETSFIPYDEVGGISWREGDHQATLIVISRLRNLARRLTVPGDKYRAAQRLLRDKIGEQPTRFTGLDLGGDSA